MELMRSRAVGYRLERMQMRDALGVRLRLPLS